MDNRFQQLHRMRSFVLGAATLALLWLPGAAQAQSAPPADARQPAPQNYNAAPSQNGQKLQDFDPGRESDRKEVASFDLFLDQHEEIGQLVRSDPSKLDNQKFLNDHPVLQSYLQNSPRVRDWVRLDAPAFMRQVDAYNRDPNGYGHPDGGQGGQGFGEGHDRDRREVASFDLFLDQHREIAEQVRRDPTLLDNQRFLNNHPVLQSYLQNSPRVSELASQNPDAFMHQVDQYARNTNGDQDPWHYHAADFGGFLRNHDDIRRDMEKDPNCFKDHDYMQNHADFDAYLNAHPEVRNDLMADPQKFVAGAQAYNNGSGAGSVSGAGMGTGTGSGSMNGRGTTGTGTSTSTSTTTRNTIPKL